MKYWRVKFWRMYIYLPNFCSLLYIQDISRQIGKLTTFVKFANTLPLKYFATYNTLWLVGTGHPLLHSYIGTNILNKKYILCWNLT